ncbi:hypothetical protein Hanom_Chr10g00881821 [Helianthus anomalus]
MTGGSKTYIPKNFYITGGSKTSILKNFYTKATYITLLSEKFGGSGAPPRLFYTSPLLLVRPPTPKVQCQNNLNKTTFLLVADVTITNIQN